MSCVFLFELSRPCEVYSHYNRRECTLSTPLIDTDISAVIMQLRPCQMARLTNSTQNTERPLSNQLDLHCMHWVNSRRMGADEWHARGGYFFCDSGTMVHGCNKSRGERFCNCCAGTIWTLCISFRTISFKMMIYPYLPIGIQKFFPRKI